MRGYVLPTNPLIGGAPGRPRPRIEPYKSRQFDPGIGIQADVPCSRRNGAGKVLLQVLVRHEYRADRKERLGELVRRVADSFESAGVDYRVRASFSDGPLAEGVSAVARAVKKYPVVASLKRADAPLPGLPAVPRLSNVDEEVEFPLELVLALCDGVPRSLPFNSVQILLAAAAFGSEAGATAPVSEALGVAIGDNWWVNGRKRTLSAGYLINGDEGSTELPPPPPAVTAVLEALGKPKKSAQHVLSGIGVATPGSAPSGPPESELAAIVQRYRSRIGDFAAGVGSPHSLPPLAEALGMPAGSGPLKPTLTAAFGPRGYDCRGGSGTFTLRRRTASNLVVELVLDVGTWSRMVKAVHSVLTPTATARVPIPVGGALQYPIGDTDRWRQIVDNLAAVVDELDRAYVPELEKVLGPVPEWFEPGR